MRTELSLEENIVHLYTEVPQIISYEMGVDEKKEKKLLEEEFLNGFFIEHNGLPCVFTLDYFDTTTSMNQSWFRGTFVCDKPIESLENLHIHVSLFSEYFETFHHFVTLTLKGKEWECIFDKEQQHYPDSVSAHYLGTLFSRFLV